MRHQIYLHKKISTLAQVKLQSFTPSKFLSQWIDNYWMATGDNIRHHTEFFQADGGTGLIFNLGDP
ncbi:hypothetical protein MJH12_18130, partial [bacterium]|nr:hypothetical protein [bacterium]